MAASRPVPLAADRHGGLTDGRRGFSSNRFRSSIGSMLGGALAFKRWGDPGMGSFSDAVVLKTFGEVPDRLDEL